MKHLKALSERLSSIRRMQIIIRRLERLCKFHLTRHYYVQTLKAFNSFKIHEIFPFCPLGL